MFLVMVKYLVQTHTQLCNIRHIAKLEKNNEKCFIIKELNYKFEYFKLIVCLISKISLKINSLQIGAGIRNRRQCFRWLKKLYPGYYNNTPIICGGLYIIRMIRDLRIKYHSRIAQ